MEGGKDNEFVSVTWDLFVPDSVTSPESDVLGNWSVLLLRLRKLLLGTESPIALCVKGESTVSLSFVLEDKNKCVICFRSSVATLCWASSHSEKGRCASSKF
jgi:hypothetical protein